MRSAIPASLAIGLFLAACQSGGGGSPSEAASASPSADSPAASVQSAEASAEASVEASAEESHAPTGPANVIVADMEGVGSILAGGEGWALYLFTNDPEGGSACTGDCATNWPPFTVPDEASLVPGEGVTAAMGVIERDDGSLQVTANGHPLYRYAGDTAPGMASGHGVGSVWFAVTARGDAARSPGDEYPY